MTSPEVANAAPARPTVSVIMANYNGAVYLTQAIRSVQRQTLRDLELIVSDDASSDDSIRIVTKFMVDDSRIRLLRSDQNRGPAAARNRALDVAKGEWIAIVDSDDLIHPTRLARLVELAVREDADMIADDLLIFDSGPSHTPEPLFTGKWARSPFWVGAAQFIRANQLYGKGPLLGYLKPIFRASVIRAFALRYDETLRIAEDYHFVLSLLYLGKRLRVHPLLLYFYRKHSDSISHRLTEHAIAALKAADQLSFARADGADPHLLAALKARARALDTAFAYEKLLSSLKTKDLFGALQAVRSGPKALLLLRLPIGVRLLRLISPRTAPRTRQESKHDKVQACVISRQRVIGRTNGSSTYLLDLARAITSVGYDIHFLAPSPTTLGRWPFLLLSNDMSVFKSISIRGTWRWGRCIISHDPRQIVRGSLALLDRFLVNRGWISQPHFKRAPYSIAQPLTREDQLYLARRSRAVGDFLIADYCFLTEAFPYMLRPEARTAVIMHDRFSSRSAQFDALATKDSVVSLTEDEECDRLAQADILVAIQHDEGQFVRTRLPSHRVIVAPMAASPTDATQIGNNDQLLFVASSAAPNVDGIRWFLSACWPQIRARRPATTLSVVGTVCDALGPPPDGAKFMGFVKDLSPLYREAGLVISPLRIGSGLKIKLIEALEHGKAVVATSKTLQGVEHLLAGGVEVADDAVEFINDVCRFLSDEKARVDLANKGRDALTQHFSQEACYGSLLREMSETNSEKTRGDIHAAIGRSIANQTTYGS
jgi:succinoglycan biosynthesis protein ExoO